MIVLAEQDVLAARSGDRVALTRVVEACSGPVFNLAYRMLGHRADAEDATQEILVKVVTHLGSVREPGAAGGWVLRVAFHHLIHERRRGVLESQQLTFTAFAEDLETGLAPIDDSGLSEPERELAIRQVKEGCTLAMLCCLSRALRATYILGEVFEMSDADGAAVLELSPAAYRQRLKRARQAVFEFASRHCGIVTDSAPCRCDRRVSRAIELARICRPLPDEIENARPDVAALKAHVQQLEEGRRVAALMRSNPSFETEIGALVMSMLDAGRGGGSTEPAIDS